LLDILTKAREYNEDIYPVFEQWLAKQREPISFLTMQETRKFIESGDLPPAVEIEQRKVIAFVYRNEGGHSYISSGEQARRDAKKLEKIAGSNLNTTHKVIKGVTVNRGTYTGKVRVVKDFREFKKIKPGEVVVTTTTRPDYNQYIMKAGAIVGDERSLMSHTAIVAREFKIPCIVGTKVATQVLKDGDMVKVDAGKGEVTKL